MYCQYGTTTSYGRSTTPFSLGSGTSNIDGGMQFFGLTANTVYHIRAVATNSGGTTYGDDMTFTTLPIGLSVPLITTNTVMNITTTTARLYCTANPVGSQTNTYLQYGTTSNYGNTTATQAIGSGITDVIIYADISNLIPNTLYHVRGVASNSFGIIYGGDATFTTASSTSIITVNPTTLGFSNQIVNTISNVQSYSISGNSLISNITITPPNGFQISQSSGSGFTSLPIVLTPVNGIVNAIIYVKFIPTSAGTYNGNITNKSNGAITQNISVSGTGINIPNGSIKPTVSNTTISQGTEFWIEVKVGDPTEAADLYGISFKLSSNNRFCSYVDGSAVSENFLGPSPLFSQN